MNSEITKIKDMNWLQGWVFYDHLCPVCRAWAQRMEPTLSRRGFDLAPLQSPWLQECLDCPLDPSLDEMKVLTRHGQLLGGADALLYLAGKIWWAWPVWLIGGLPGVKPLLRLGYRRFAAHRYCHGGACSLARTASRPWRDFLPLVLLVTLSAALRAQMSAWVFMWVMSVALFAGMKWVAWMSCRRELGVFPRPAFLLGWPGLDPKPFLAGRAGEGVSRWTWVEVWRPFGALMLGSILVWVAPRLMPPESALLRGWSGMIGVCLLLHFGVFSLLAHYWWSRGVRVEMIMKQPTRARSLAEFWGRRWNRAFSAWASHHVSGPLAKKVGHRTAVLAAFLVSGVMHELVISLPTRAGYGGPTLYFLIQGLGLVFEQSGLGRHLGLGKAWLGRVYALGFAILPVSLLFHPPFINQIILPMLAAWGACGKETL